MIDLDTLEVIQVRAAIVADRVRALAFERMETVADANRIGNDLSALAVEVDKIGRRLNSTF
jgi:hypothetical protein